jgi:hypothetical protein
LIGDGASGLLARVARPSTAQFCATSSPAMEKSLGAETTTNRMDHLAAVPRWTETLLPAMIAEH